MMEPEKFAAVERVLERDAALRAKLAEQSKKINEMCQTEGWGVWLEWSKEMRAGLADIALRDADPAVREESRMTMLALEKFEKLPLFVVSYRQEG